MQQLQEPSASATHGSGWGSGHVFRVDRKTGVVWYAKYRQPDGRQVQKKIGPVWSDRGRPPAGYFTKRTAEAWLRVRLEQVRKGDLPAPQAQGVTFADAAREWLRYVEEDRAVKPSGPRVLFRAGWRGMWGTITGKGTPVVRWEFTYADLFLGGGKDLAAVHSQWEYIAGLGAEGWEPVAPVTFSYIPPNHMGPATKVPMLMFKRPLGDA